MIEPLAPDLGLRFHHGTEWRFGKILSTLLTKGKERLSEQNKQKQKPNKILRSDK